jgi:hypothetical protein
MQKMVVYVYFLIARIDVYLGSTLFSKKNNQSAVGCVTANTTSTSTNPAICMAPTLSIMALDAQERLLDATGLSAVSVKDTHTQIAMSFFPPTTKCVCDSQFGCRHAVFAVSLQFNDDSHGCLLGERCFLLFCTPRTWKMLLSLPSISISWT